ncbi:hypothetical protein EX30DRAFT_314088 [Ascodesmis nigricans]|uniref:Ribosomal protein L34 n=1 Tax=Ascodesmis nigricans TaxID=341454 RepID=A0A4S2N728_9PEZI|nr:hypothetical protein EX30DRAFT_314088 [Ascodesmis nigricans]
MFSLPRLARAATSATKSPLGIRTFTFLSPLRPTVLPRTPLTNPVTPPSSAPQNAIEAATETLMPRISESPVLRTLQVRCGPRQNFNAITHIIRKRRHGFLSRIRTRKGRNILKRRQAKKRTNLSH